MILNLFAVVWNLEKHYCFEIKRLCFSSEMNFRHCILCHQNMGEIAKLVFFRLWSNSSDVYALVFFVFNVGLQSVLKKGWCLFFLPEENSLSRKTMFWTLKIVDWINAGRQILDTRVDRAAVRGLIPPLLCAPCELFWVGHCCSFLKVVSFGVPQHSI